MVESQFEAAPARARARPPIDSMLALGGRAGVRAGAASNKSVPRWGDRRRVRVGLLGGSFNPAHAGHLAVARTALARLMLDQVWLLVSPGNPLKAKAAMASLAARLASARGIADGRRIVATDIERALGTRFTRDTLRALRRLFPRVQFIWLMGADNLATLPRWRGWMAIARSTKIAVLPRPTYNHRALASQAARRLRPWRVAASRASVLATRSGPGWVFLQVRQSPHSATALRHEQHLFSGDTS